jgi:hypothetical protein
VLKRTSQPLPRWKDEAGVAALVEEYMAKLGVIPGHFAEFAVATRRREPPRPGQNHWDDVIWLLREERDAVEAAVCRQSISDSLLGNLRECLAHLV